MRKNPLFQSSMKENLFFTGKNSSKEDIKYREEKDSMGKMEVPKDALYGASTQRAVLNFPISNLRFSEIFIRSLGLIKLASAHANKNLGLLSESIVQPIIKAAEEITLGHHFEHFVVDIFQTGSGTSTNMNANEVIAHRAAALQDKSVAHNAQPQKIHPNDHVNMCQSSNDVIPTTMNVSCFLSIKESLLPSLYILFDALKKKEGEFNNVIKSGRTHLQDATPVTLGQEFGGYAAQIGYGIKRIESVLPRLAELALGGTAVGTGINTHPDFAKTAIAFITKYTGISFQEAPNHFEAQGSRDVIVELSGQLKTVACSLMKIANDIRWLSSGPRCALGEIYLPATQPGSSIMPAKVNPVICESVMMACAQIMGNDTVITVSGQHGNFELNVMLPVIAYNILQSIDILATSAKNFSEKCICGIEADKERCLDYAEKSLSLCTSLAPIIGYDKAAEIAKKALLENTSVRKKALEMNVLPEEELKRVLDLHAMTKPGL
jgi:fumarate hydratase, class II